MVATIAFYAGDWGALPVDAGGSGLGLYGPTGFGQSVGVGQFQDTTYITDSNGVIQGLPVHNIKWIHANSGIHSDNTAINYPISGIPNSKASLNVRFTNDAPVRCQNVKARVFDRDFINNDPSGVQCYLAELIQPEILNPNFTTIQPFSSFKFGQFILTPSGNKLLCSHRCIHRGQNNHQHCYKHQQQYGLCVVLWHILVDIGEKHKSIQVDKLDSLKV